LSLLNTILQCTILAFLPVVLSGCECAGAPGYVPYWMVIITVGISHHTGLQIIEQYTETGGATDHVFGLCALLGFRFAPPARLQGPQVLYTAGPGSSGDTVTFRGRHGERQPRRGALGRN
jgi:Tn3 transposase DDE domain